MDQQNITTGGITKSEYEIRVRMASEHIDTENGGLEVQTE